MMRIGLGQQQAGRIALRIALDLATRRVRRVLGVADGAQGGSRGLGLPLQGPIFATPVITLDSLEHAIAQAKWVVSMGVRAVLMPMGPFEGRSPADPYFDPFWSILNEAHVRVVYHVSEAIT